MASSIAVIFVALLCAHLASSHYTWPLSHLGAYKSTPESEEDTPTSELLHFETAKVGMFRFIGQPLWYMGSRLFAKESTRSENPTSREPKTRENYEDSLSSNSEYSTLSTSEDSPSSSNSEDSQSSKITDLESEELYQAQDFVRAVAGHQDEYVEPAESTAVCVAAGHEVAPADCKPLVRAAELSELIMANYTDRHPHSRGGSEFINQPEWASESASATNNKWSKVHGTTGTLSELDWTAVMIIASTQVGMIFMFMWPENAASRAQNGRPAGPGTNQGYNEANREESWRSLEQELCNTIEDDIALTEENLQDLQPMLRNLQSKLQNLEKVRAVLGTRS